LTFLDISAEYLYKTGNLYLFVVTKHIKQDSSNIGTVRAPFLRVRKGAEGALINIHTNEGALINIHTNEGA
jgi:hypothetical protein